MPVIDLADYLGMPAQAPANPVFNQTRKSTGVASLDREVEDFYKGAAAIDQLRSLQRQAPVFEAQKAQLAYDDIAQKANDLRKKQEIEAQVERAASELAGGNLNPESDDFAVKYRDLATRNPLAFSDPRFSTVAGLYENQYKGYQQAKQQRAEAEARAAQARMEAEARSAKEIIDARNRAIAFGVPPEKLPRNAGLEQIAIEEGKVKVAGKGTRGGSTSEEGRRLKNILDANKDELDYLEKQIDAFKLEDTDQKYIDAQDAVNKSRAEWIAFNRTGGVPSAPATPATQQQVSPSAAAASSALTGMASVATPFSPAALPASILASALPQAQAPKVIQEEKIDSTAEILNTDLGIPGNAEFINNKVREESLSLDARKQVLKKLEDAIKNPPSMKYLNRYQVDANKQSIANAYSNIKNSLALAETQEKIVNPVWTRAKKTMESTVNEWAKKNGYEPETIWQTILQESENGPAREVDPLSESGEKILPLTAEEILGEELSKENTDLLTVKPQIEAIRNAEAPVGARIGRFFGEESITNYDILKQIAKEKFKPVAKITKESPTGMPLTEQQQKDLDELKTLAGSK
jgi:hypothetical protein